MRQCMFIVSSLPRTPLPFNAVSINKTLYLKTCLISLLFCALQFTHGSSGVQQWNHHFSTLNFVVAWPSDLCCRVLHWFIVEFSGNRHPRNENSHPNSVARNTDEPAKLSQTLHAQSPHCQAPQPRIFELQAPATVWVWNSSRCERSDQQKQCTTSFTGKFLWNDVANFCEMTSVRLELQPAKCKCEGWVWGLSFSRQYQECEVKNGGCGGFPLALQR
jgi:hypothetical protein